MSAVKVHLVTGTNHGTESCDFRGPLEIGHAQGDEHKTIFEVDPASEELVSKVLELGPQLNSILSEMSKSADGIDLLGGKDLFLRLGVWDS